MLAEKLCMQKRATFFTQMSVESKTIRTLVEKHFTPMVATAPRPLSRNYLGGTVFKLGAVFSSLFSPFFGLLALHVFSPMYMGIRSSGSLRCLAAFLLSRTNPLTFDRMEH
ncbi:unnamed protein product [Acanthoscelides obtectus]|uniref:Transmembrane protein n=1 Tax=Acanthoscelides obtectus TaxID=200917 RepID=A0A9P0PCM1_ACAOB|nr:unnamed protein product [Acanthoscelides obtectus]CAK1667558.1 hypothetical protein AOBTE_LOCUS25909 [Acanthoscelides obtectus]